MGGIYILHFDAPVSFKDANKYGDQRHYVGYARDFDKRIDKHLIGLGSKMTQAAKSQGVSFVVAGQFPIESLLLEQDITKQVRKYCDICKTSGVYVWELPDGRVVADRDKNFLSIEGQSNDYRKMRELALAAGAMGIFDGAPRFLPNHYKF